MRLTSLVTKSASHEQSVSLLLPTLRVTPRASLASAGVNPSRDGRLRLRFALPGAGAARLEVFDVGGRRVAAREVGALGAGSHVATFGDDAPLPPGLYLARLTRGSASSSARVVVTR